MPGIQEMLERVAKSKGINYEEWIEGLKHKNQWCVLRPALFTLLAAIGFCSTLVFPVLIACKIICLLQCRKCGMLVTCTAGSEPVLCALGLQAR